MTHAEGRDYSDQIRELLKHTNSDLSCHWDTDRGMVVTLSGMVIWSSKSARKIEGFVEGYDIAFRHCTVAPGY